MYKLLPEKARENVRREYLLRRTVVMLAATILVLVVAMVGLFPSYVLSKAEQKEVLEGVKSVGLSDFGSAGDDIDTWLTQINLKLKVLSPRLDEDRPSLAILEVISDKKSGVRLTGFNWMKSEGKTALFVTGVAEDRQALLAFETKLNDSGAFSAVTLPVSNLAKDKDINFEIKLVLTKPQ
jgi:hypothetical protein